MGSAASVSAPVKVSPVRNSLPSTYCLVAAWVEARGSPARMMGPVKVPPAFVKVVESWLSTYCLVDAWDAVVGSDAR